MGGGLIKGRWRRNGEEKEKEGRGLYCNGPGYKTAGYKAGKTARAGPRSEVRDPATFFLGISRAGWPKWSSNARFARLLSPNEAALAPSFVAVLRSYARPSSSRIDSRERATNSLEFRYSLFFFFYRDQPSSASFFCSLLSPRIACQFFILIQRRSRISFFLR